MTTLSEFDTKILQAQQARRFAEEHPDGSQRQLELLMDSMRYGFEALIIALEEEKS